MLNGATGADGAGAGLDADDGQLRGAKKRKVAAAWTPQWGAAGWPAVVNGQPADTNGMLNAATGGAAAGSHLDMLAGLVDEHARHEPMHAEMPTAGFVWAPMMHAMPGMQLEPRVMMVPAGSHGLLGMQKMLMYPMMASSFMAASIQLPPCLDTQPQPPTVAARPPPDVAEDSEVRLPRWRFSQCRCVTRSSLAPLHRRSQMVGRGRRRTACASARRYGGCGCASVAVFGMLTVGGCRRAGVALLPRSGPREKTG
jgi:hypothetical protein